MTFELIAILIAGIGGAGIGLFLKRVLRLPLPAWTAPAVAGLCMIVMSIWSEYNWFARLQAGIPEGVQLAHAGTATRRRPIWCWHRCSALPAGRAIRKSW